jgi:hypothetical protein
MKAITLLAALPLAACMTLTPDDARHVTYACDGGPEITVVYAGSTARIENPGGPRIELQRLERPTGVIYSSAIRTIRGEGDTITYQIGRAAPMTCTAVAPQP